MATTREPSSKERDPSEHETVPEPGRMRSFLKTLRSYVADQDGEGEAEMVDTQVGKHAISRIGATVLEYVADQDRRPGATRPKPSSRFWAHLRAYVADQEPPKP